MEAQESFPFSVFKRQQLQNMYFAMTLEYWVWSPTNPQEFESFGNKNQYELVKGLNYRFYFNYFQDHSSSLECSEHLAQW